MLFKSCFHSSHFKKLLLFNTSVSNLCSNKNTKWNLPRIFRNTLNLESTIKSVRWNLIKLKSKKPGIIKDVILFSVAICKLDIPFVVNKWNCRANKKNIKLKTFQITLQIISEVSFDENFKPLIKLMNYYYLKKFLKNS